MDREGRDPGRAAAVDGLESLDGLLAAVGAATAPDEPSTAVRPDFDRQRRKAVPKSSWPRARDQR